MPTFGHKLRHERESRNTRIQDIADRSGIDHGYLEALEENDFDALPGPRGFGKLYIRAYAHVLGFDPQPMIEEFEKERRRQEPDDDTPPRPVPRRAKRIHYEPPPRKTAQPKPKTPPIVREESPPDSPAEPLEPEPIVEVAVAEPPEPVREEPSLEEPIETPEPDTSLETPPADRSSPRMFWIGLGLAALVAVPLAVVALRPEPPPPPRSSDAPTEAPAATAVPPVEVTSPRPEPPVKSPIRVSDSGIGTSVVDRRLVGSTTRFTLGSNAYFFTRVTGAESETSIRHVWLHEGRVIHSRELPVRGANWRTFSGKRLEARGNWTVEARDADGRVLAHAEFRCEARQAP